MLCLLLLACTATLPTATAAQVTSFPIPSFADGGVERHHRHKLLRAFKRWLVRDRWAWQLRRRRILQHQCPAANDRHSDSI